jgi:hypothetical protein
MSPYLSHFPGCAAGTDILRAIFHLILELRRNFALLRTPLLNIDTTSVKSDNFIVPLS